mgnify:CR=1 FL=1
MLRSLVSAISGDAPAPSEPMAKDLELRIIEATFDSGPLRVRLSESTDGAVRVRLRPHLCESARAAAAHERVRARRGGSLCDGARVGSRDLGRERRSR